MRNAWAVVQYSDGKAVGALWGDEGLWQSHSTSTCYDKLREVVEANPAQTWGLVQLHRGAETNLILEIGK